MDLCRVAESEDTGRSDFVTAAALMPGHPLVMGRVALPYVIVGCKYAR